MNIVTIIRKKDGRGKVTPELLNRHVGHLSGLDNKGRLIFAGPFLDDSDGGMYAGSFRTLDDAVTFSENDPFIMSGEFTYELHPWDRSFMENTDKRPMDFSDLLAQRRTVRDFKEGALDGRVIRKLLALALRAPSEFNLQPWKVLVCDTPARKRRLKKCCFGQAQVEKAGAAFVVFGDPQDLIERAETAVSGFIAAKLISPEQRDENLRLIRDYYGGEQSDIASNALRNAVIFGHQLLLCALSLGLDGFWLGGVDRALLIREFSLPPGLVLAGVVGVGTGKGALPEIPRRDLDEIILPQAG